MKTWTKCIVGALAALGIVSAAHAGPYVAGNPATLQALPADFTLCAEGGKVCKVPAGATAYVAYGLGTKFNTAQGTGDFTCLPKGWVKSPSPATPQDVGVDDPIPGGAKNCYAKFSGGVAVTPPPASSLATYGPGNPPTLTTLPADFKLCAEGGKVCKVANATATTYVLYGKGNKFNTAQGKGDFTCLPKGWVKTPSAATPQDVGVDDPIPGGAKDCYVQVAKGTPTQPTTTPPATTTPPPAPPVPPQKPAVQAAPPAGASGLAIPSGAVLCAADGKICNATGDWTGVYGVTGKFVAISGNGPFTCLPKGFVKFPSATTPKDTGADDPASGVVKSCYVVGKIAAAAATTTAAPVNAASSPTCKTAWDASGIKSNANCLYRNASGREFGNECVSEAACSCQCAANMGKPCTYKGNLLREPVCKPGS